MNADTKSKKKKEHPWRAAIRNHVTEAAIRRQIWAVEEQIAELQIKLKSLKAKLREIE